MKEVLKTVLLVFVCLFMWLVHWIVGLAATIAVILYRRKKRRQKLTEQFREVYALPLPAEWQIKNGKEAKKVKRYLKLYRKQTGRGLYDLKLRAFYDICISAESPEDSYVVPYRELLENSSDAIGILRMDKDEELILSGDELEIDTIIADGFKELKPNKLSGCATKMKELKSADVTNFLGFTSRSKIEEQTRDMQRIVENAQAECRKLQAFVPLMNKLLVTVRLAAYRNIYLSMELLGYIRDNVGGSSLTTQKDRLEVKNEDIKSIEFKGTDLSMDSFASLSTGAMTAIEAISSNKELESLAGDNPKMAAAGVAIMAGLNYLMERNAVIENNLQAQETLVKGLEDLTSAYVESKAGLRRSLEIIKAIVKANKGFVAVYAPLRDKVFEEGSAGSVSMLELQQLVMATNEYNKITKSKIK